MGEHRRGPARQILVPAGSPAILRPALRPGPREEGIAAQKRTRAGRALLWSYSARPVLATVRKLMNDDGYTIRIPHRVQLPAPVWIERPKDAQRSLTRARRSGSGSWRRLASTAACARARPPA
jgi:hypothetical protein